MGIRGNVEEIINFAQQVQTDNNCKNKDLLQIYEGNLKVFVEEALATEFSGKTFPRIVPRIAPINIFQRLINKIAKVYAQGVERKTEDTKDKQLVKDYEGYLDIDNEMAWSDKVYNAVRSCAFEPYLDDKGFPRLRILAPHQFTVWSDNRVDPTQETVFIKFFGTANSVNRVDEAGEGDCADVNVYLLADEEEFLIVDSQQNERPELLSNNNGDPGGKHDVGRIPFVYQKNTRTQLVPDPNEDDKAMAILIPILYTDLNYASKYLSHGIRYGIDIDGSNLEGNPDSMWIVNSKEGDNKKPQIGVLAPSVDIDKVIKLIKNETGAWLEAKSIKAGSTGEADNSISGLAKVIDNADVTDVRKENSKAFENTEEDELWPLIKAYHNNVWVPQDLLHEDVNKDNFSEDFIINIEFGDMTPITDPQEKRDDLKFRLDNKLITRERAIREVNPKMEVSEQDQLIAEVKAEQSNEPKEEEKDTNNSNEKE